MANHFLPHVQLNFRFACAVPTNIPKFVIEAILRDFRFCILQAWTKVPNHFLPHLQLHSRFACALPTNIPKFVVEAILRDFGFDILQAWTTVAKFTLCATGF